MTNTLSDKREEHIRITDNKTHYSYKEKYVKQFIKDLKDQFKYRLYPEENQDNTYYTKGWDDCSKKIRQVINEIVDKLAGDKLI